MYLLLCRSLTYAQRCEKLLERKGITATITKAPREAAVNGCSYCLRIHPRVREQALDLLEKAGLSPDRIFFMDNGHITEVGV